MSNIYRWGIVGPGGIAHHFADALSHIENATLQAVASKNPQRAKDFAQNTPYQIVTIVTNNYFQTIRLILFTSLQHIIFIAKTPLTLLMLKSMSSVKSPWQLMLRR